MRARSRARLTSAAGHVHGTIASLERMRAGPHDAEHIEGELIKAQEELATIEDRIRALGPIEAHELGPRMAHDPHGRQDDRER